MLSRLKGDISRNLTNLRGWKTNRKIVVFESDDWGNIRMPNTSTKDRFESKGYDLSKNPYCLNDTLANTEDLELLFSILSKHIDANANPALLTFNTVVANPDFIKISENNFNTYYFEPFTDTLKKYYPKENVFQLWEDGIKSKLIKPQFHGREHVNVPIWLNQLKTGNRPLLDAFELGFWGIPKHLYKPDFLNIQASYDSCSLEATHFYMDAIDSGLNLFNEIFHFKSKSFIANNYTWSSNLNSCLKLNGIDFLQGSKYQKLPRKNNSNKRKRNLLYTGLKNIHDQYHLVRNCVFEPSQFSNNSNNVGNCLKQMNFAFSFKKPAIITTHRLNFIGSLSKANRNSNLEQFDNLLTKAILRWPDIEFMSSDQLGEIIKGNVNS